MKNCPLLLLLVIIIGSSCRAFAHSEDLRSGALQPRVGVMSEEVVREKFKSYGMEITKLERQKGIYVVHTLLGGNPAVLEVESSTGGLKYEGKSLRLIPTALAAPLAVKPDPKRVPWVQRTIRFEKMGIEGIRLPARPINP